MNNNDKQRFRKAMEQFSKHIRDLEERVVSCCGLTFAQCNAVTEIGRAGCVSLNQLAELLDVDKSTMSLTISNLVKQKLVHREQDASDRRYVSIVLTQEGQKAFENIQTGMEMYYSDLSASIPENASSQVIDSITILNSILAKEKSCKC